jgi:hypothetical protein
LSFPRLYFKGAIQWDPCTFNNNDWQQMPTYDATNAALNWPYLNGQGITQDNFPQTFRPWAITLQEDTQDSPAGARIPTEWNMFGTHGVSFVQHGAGQITQIIGGTLGVGKSVTNGDPIIGAKVALSGDNGRGPGRLVDTNPSSFWSSQVFWGKFAFAAAGIGFSGPLNFRMHSRWLNLNRIYSTDRALTAPAASVACCLQTCIPTSDVNWENSKASQLVQALRDGASAPGAKGIMIRFTAYVNLYFVNGIFNSISTMPRNFTELADVLAAAWAAFNKNGDTSKFFSNPCYSHVVGAVGVWNDGELASVPGGRYLVPLEAIAPVQPAAPTAAPSGPLGHAQAAAAASSPNTTVLGPVAAQVDEQAGIVSLDLSSTMPENGTPGQWPSDLTKTDFGALTLGVQTATGFTPVATIDYEQYARASYEATAGIVDITLPDPSVLKSGPLAIRAQGVVALAEQPFAAQTDSRGIYLNQEGAASFNVSVFNMGAPAPGASVLVAQYDQGLNLVPSNLTHNIHFTNGTLSTATSGGITTNVTTVVADDKGVATVSIAADAPGFPVLAFFPYSGTAPALPAALNPGPPWSESICFAYYTTVRVLPFDDGVPARFIALWNATHDSTQAWNFVYTQILYLYDMLFSVMLEFVNLGSQSAVEKNIDKIWPMISKAAAAESTFAMPITRDLSAGKRLTLQLWIYLVANKYNVPELTAESIPAGWAPK